MHYFDRARNVIAALRNPQSGCPWDLEQTHESLRPYLIEECYELLHALGDEDTKLSKEELGDVLLQILLHAQLFEEEKQFNIQDVCDHLSDKIIRRHPHVFGDEKKKPSMEELHRQWNQIKKDEGKKEAEFFPEKYLHLPSLQSAYKIGQKSNKIDFDWDNATEVIEKVQEELNELKLAIENGKSSYIEGFEDNIEEELGDFLFTAAQLSRHLKRDPEVTLSKANAKFYHRFNKLLKMIHEDGKQYRKLSREDKESYWKKVKESETP